MRHPRFLLRTNGPELLFLSVACIFLGLPKTRAQHQFTMWAGTFHTYKISPKTGLYADVQWRSTAQVAQTQALLLRPGFTFFIMPRLSATAGYALIHQQRIAAGITDYLPEHRTWEQLAYTHPVNQRHAHHTTTLTHRLRLEQRYLPRFAPQDGRLVRSHHVTAHRLRYFARAVIPLRGKSTANPANGQSPAHNPTAPVFEKGFFAALQNEVFLHLADKSAVNGKVFDQNRAYAALGYRMSKKFDFELGYLNQYVSGAGAATSVNHVLQVATYVRL